MTPEEAKNRIHDLVHELEPNGPPAILLRHPISGALFVDGELLKERDSAEVVKVVPPSPPGAEKLVGDDGAGNPVFAPWEPGELEAAQARYAAAAEQWATQSRTHTVYGSTRYDVTLRTADGSDASFERRQDGVWIPTAAALSTEAIRAK